MQHSFTTLDPRTLHVDEGGQGAPVVFVHELGRDHRVWEPEAGAWRRPDPCASPVQVTRAD